MAIYWLPQDFPTTVRNPVNPKSLSDPLLTLYLRSQEGETGIIELKEVDSVAVELMIHYLYKLDYPHIPTKKDEQDTYVYDPYEAGTKGATYIIDKWGCGALHIPPHLRQLWPDGPNLTIHAKVYALGAMYGIPGLKALALEKFKLEATYFWDTDDFITAAGEVYTTTVDSDRDMRALVVGTILQHTGLLDIDEVQAVIKTVPDLSFDILMHARKNSLRDILDPAASRNVTLF